MSRGSYLEGGRASLRCVCAGGRRGRGCKSVVSRVILHVLCITNSVG